MSKSIGQQIRSARIKNAMSQLELADKMKSSVNRISRWENDVTSPSLDDLETLANILHTKFSNENFETVNLEYENADINELIAVLQDMRLDAVKKDKVQFWMIYLSVLSIVLLMMMFIAFIFYINIRFNNPITEETMTIFYNDMEE